MKNIKLKKLKLVNYRNIDFAEYDFDGSSVILGDNRIGKTNTLESIYYLLTDSLLNNSNDIAQIKPLKDTSLQVKVEGTFDVDGKELTIAKEYQENWVKVRNTGELVLKGHSTTYYFNGAKTSTVKEYNRLISEEFGFAKNDLTKVDYTKLLIDPFYLGELGESDDWSEFRAFIIHLVGDVKDDDVFAKDSTLSPIKEDLQKINGKTDLLKKSIKSQIEDTQTKITEFDGQIKLLEQTTRPADGEVAIARKGLEDIDERINNLKSGQAIDKASQDIEDTIRNIDIELLDLKKAESEKGESPEKKLLEKDLRDYQGKIDYLANQRSSTLINKNKTESDCKILQTEIDIANKKRTEIINEIKTLDESVKNIGNSIEKECPLCHHQLSEEEVAKHIAEYKENASKKRLQLIEQGKSNTAIKTDKEKSLANKKDLLNTYDSTLNNIEKERTDAVEKLNEIQERIDELELNQIKVENPKINELNATRESLKQKLVVSKNTFALSQKNLNSAIYELEQEKIPFQKVIDDLSYFDRCQSQLEVIKNNKREKGQELIALEQKIDLIKKFIYRKLQMLDENVAKVFGNIKIQLIKENINGGYDTICKPYIFDSEKDESTKITWKSGSKSERVITGVAIAEKIKLALNLPNLPILFDEGGEISTNTFASKIKTESQIICVKVVDNVLKPVVKSIEVNSTQN